MKIREETGTRRQTARRPSVVWALALWLVLGPFAAVGFSQTFDPWSHAITPIKVGGAINWVDVDNDGDLDLFITGGDYRPVTHLYLNDGTGAFTEVGQNLRISATSTAWYDIDADGDLDLFISGTYAREDFGDSYWPGATNALFLNDGHGAFEHALDLPGPLVTIGDVDNDGRPEILWRVDGERHRFLNVVHSGNSFGFVAKEAGYGPNLYGVTQWKDFDRDGDVDALNFRWYVFNYPNIQIYRNDGGISFTEIPFFITMEGSVPAVEDFDRDGYPDLIASVYNSTNGQIAPILFRNNRTGGWNPINLFSGRDNVVWPIDFDGDGYWDFFWPSAGEGTNYYVHRLYRNSGVTNFTRVTHPFTPLDRPLVAWGDFTGDGSPDLFLMGPDPAVQRVYLYRNLAANARPLAPTGLQAAVGGNGVRFSWNTGSDGGTPTTSLTYELRLGRQPGGFDVIAPLSNPSTGYRRVPQAGSIVVTQWQMSGLEPGTYYWSVQTIDSGWQGSAWAPEQMITVTNTPPLIEIVREIHTGPSRVATVPLIVADAESPDADIRVTGATLNPAFVAANTISVTGTGAERTLQFRVSSSAYGTNDLTITATDPQGLFTEVRLRVASDVFAAELVTAATNYYHLFPLPADYNYPGRPPVADFDGDGDLDVLFEGAFMSNNTPYFTYVMAVNGGHGDFTFRNLSRDALTVGPDGYWLADFDRDGDIDILGRGGLYGNGVIRLSANNGRGEFASPVELGPTALMMLGDVDGDGDLDGFYLDELELDYYENLGGRFRLRPAPLTRFEVYAERGAARMGDIDADGDLDFFIPTASTNLSERLLIRSLRNQGRGRFTTEYHRILGRAEMYGIWNYDVDDDNDFDVSFWYSTNYTAPIVRGHALCDSTGRFVFSTNALANDLDAGDFNNDGLPDRIASELITDNPVTFRYRLALKTGPGRYAPQPFAISESGLIADFDNDGNLDLLAMTEERDESGYVVSPRQLRLYRNQTDVPNAPPPAPTGLSAAQETDDRVTFRWNAVTDDHTAPPLLTYNVRVGKTPGRGDVLASESDPVTGRRWIVANGNAGKLTVFHLNALPPGTYYWSVQAIDGAFLGSAWAPEQTITVRKPEISFIADVVTPPGLTSLPIAFTVNGGAFAAGTLLVSATPDDATLLPPAGLVINGSGAERQLLITPGGSSGDTDLTVTATDPAGFSSLVRFHVRVAWWDPRRLEQLGIQRYENWTWADLDADGRLDLLSHIPGIVNQVGAFTYRNVNGTSFEAISNNLPFSINFGTQAGGMPGDNYVDALTLEVAAPRKIVWHVWHGNGSASEFIPGPLRTNDAAAFGRFLWVDLDNDGLRDVVHFGWTSNAPSNAAPSGVVAARGRPDGAFEYWPWILPLTIGQSLVAGDFDADGDLDFIASGANYNSSGSLTGYMAQVYFNEGRGRFTPSAAGLPQDASYEVSVVDFDQDGRLDVLLCPSTMSTSANAPTPKLMRNVGGTFIEQPANLPRQLNLATWSDYDNDGDPDLLAITTAEFPSTGREQYYAAIYNNTLGTLTRTDTGLPDIVAHQADFADADNDGDLDLLISGEQGWNHTGRLLVFNTSPRRNQPPPPPANLAATTGLNGVLLEWHAPNDPQSGTALTYNLRVGTTPGGSEILSAVADPVTGRRRLSGVGNIGHAPRWRLDVPDGIYYWTVQAIDTAFAPSTFAEEHRVVVSRPQLSPMGDVVIGLARATTPIAFSISNGTAPFTITVESSNPALLALDAFELGGADRARTLIVRSSATRWGTATIALKVIDAVGSQDVVTFHLTVLPPLDFATDLQGVSVAQGGLAWGDPDRDGDLDLLVTGGGYETFGARASVLRNDLTGVLQTSLYELAGVLQGSAAWVDVDRDDDLDVVVTGINSSQNPSTTLYRTTPGPQFTPQASVSVRLPNLGPSTMAWADADGDGDLDAIFVGTAAGGSRETALYLNDGFGSFSNGLVALPAVTLGAVAWADFDNDGDSDFVLTGSTDATVAGALTRLYRNDGRGGFVETGFNFPGLYRSAVAWADYDRDGDPDLLAAGISRTGPLTILWRNDGGTFVRALDLPGVADGAIAWGDANLDGFPDLALAGRTTTGPGPLLTRVYWNQNGTLIDSETPLPGLHLAALAWGDLQNDGMLDLAVSGSTNNAATLNNGATFSGVYRNTLVPGRMVAPSSPVGLNATVNGSEVVLSWTPPAGGVGLSYDLIVKRTIDSTSIMIPAADLATGFRRVAQPGAAGWSGRWVLHNLLPGGYTWAVQAVDAAYRGSAFAVGSAFTIVNQPPTIATPGSQTMVMNSLLGNLLLNVSDADGDPSMLAITVASSNTRLFPAGTIHVSGGGATRTVTLAPATNESGSATLIFTVTDPGNARASASFRATVQSLVDVQAGIPDGQFSVLEAADVDKDGDLDVLVAGTEAISSSSGRASVWLLQNAGDATFTATVPVGLAPTFDRVFAAWGDYDGDGGPDLFYDGVIYRNDGPNGFVGIDWTLSGIRSGQAAWGDFDNDGDLDVAVTGNLAGNSVTRLLRNDGNDMFTAMPDTLLGLQYSSLAWGDVDGDGDLDLAIAGAATSNLLISPNGRMYRNDAGNFVEVGSFLGATTGRVTWGDINGDGRVDLLVVGTHGTTPINELHLNLGNWQFTQFNLQVGGITWTDVRLADWDGDGDLDWLGGVNSIVGAYLNPGTGTFPSPAAATVSIRCRTLRIGDFNNDNLYDVLVGNVASSGLAGQNRIYRNPRTATTMASTSMPRATVTADAVTLAWPAILATPGSTYNVRVGRSLEAGDVLSPLSLANGTRVVAQDGNAGFSTTYRLRQLQPGTYYWAVQTVDSTWHGSAWTPGGTFAIGDWPTVKILSFESTGVNQWRLGFNGPAGKTVGVEMSTDLRNWSEVTQVLVGIVGTGEAMIEGASLQQFYRLVVKP